MRKGQAALEFLTTYGWAFMVVLVMIGALAYFGVINPNKLLPDKCVFGTGVGCQDFIGIIASNQIKAQLVNGFGYTVSIADVEISCTGTSDCTACSNTYNDGNNFCHLTHADYGAGAEAKNWKSDEMRELIVDAPSLSSSDRPKVNVVIKYKKGGSTYEKTVEGEISVKPQ